MARLSTLTLFLLIALAGTIVVQRPAPLRPSGQQPRLSRRTEMLAAEEAAKTLEGGDSSMLSSTSNLVKSIVGSGVFTLPFGISAYSSARLALLPALALLGTVTLLSAYCFVTVARVVEATGASSWAEAWSKTVGERSSWLPALFVGGLCFSAQLQYTMILGDTFSAIFGGLGLPWLGTRTGSILALTGLVTLPLSLLPNMSMLRYSSSLGVVSLLYTAVFMAWRAAGGHYAPGTPLHAAIPAAALQPRFASAAATAGGGHLPPLLSQLLSPRTFKLISILATAMVATFLAPQFFADLAPAPPPAATASVKRAPTGGGSARLRRFRTLAAWGYSISALLTAVVMAAGYLTFGGACDGFVLNNYATSDGLAQLVRIVALPVSPCHALPCLVMPGHALPHTQCPIPGLWACLDADSRLCGLPRRRRASRWADRSSARTRCCTRACATSSARRCARATYPHRASPPRLAPSASRQLLPSHSPTSAP